MISASIRVRPFNYREVCIHQKGDYPLFLRPIIKMNNQRQLLTVYEEANNDESLPSSSSTTSSDHSPAIPNTYKETRKEREVFDGFHNLFWSIPIEQGFSFQPFADQKHVHEKVGRPAVEASFIHNTVVYLYGITSSGKSTTCFGRYTSQDTDNEISAETKHEGRGLLDRILEDIFAKVDQVNNDDMNNDKDDDDSSNVRYRVEVRSFEFYNEKYRDCLPSSNASDSDSSSPSIKSEFQVPKESPPPGTSDDDDFVEIPKREVRSLEEAKAMFLKIANNRRYYNVRMGLHHFRSFGICEITLTKITTIVKNSSKRVFHRTTTLKLVDGAGSEKIRIPSASSIDLKQAVNLNKSITTLRKCFDAVVDGSTINFKNKKNMPIVPTRESIVTRYLADIFYGKAKLFWIGTISPHEVNLEDTMATLRYSFRILSVWRDGLRFRDPLVRVDENSNDDIKKDIIIKVVTEIPEAEEVEVVS